MTGELAGQDRRRMASAGVLPMPTAQALALLDAAVAADEPTPAAVRLHRDTLRTNADEGRLPAQLRGLVPPIWRRAAASGAGAQDLVRRVRDLPAAQREQVVVSAVRAEAAAVLGHAGADAVRPGKDFKELGFDSLAAVELRNRLGAITGLRLPASLVFDHPNPQALAVFLLEELAPDRSQDPEADLRELLVSIPLERLRGSGLLADLLALAGAPATATSRDDDRIDSMDAEDLVTLVLGRES